MPRPRRNFTLRLTDQLLDDVTRFAEEEGVSVNYWIGRLVAREADRILKLKRDTDRIVNGAPIVSGNRFVGNVSREVADEVLGVPAEVLDAHAQLMENTTGTRPDTVRRGDKEAPMPRVRPAKSEAEPRFKKGQKP